MYAGKAVDRSHLADPVEAHSSTSSPPRKRLKHDQDVFHNPYLDLEAIADDEDEDEEMGEDDDAFIDHGK